MTACEIADKIDGRVLADNGLNVCRFYCGDFLSRVMGKAPIGCGWLTVINNIDVAGVAAVADIPLIILCEDVTPNEELLQRCKQENIALISTALPIFEGCTRLTGFKDGIKHSA